MSFSSRLCTRGSPCSCADVFVHHSCSAQRGAVHDHTMLGRGDDTVGNPHRAQVSRFELFELILLVKIDKQFPVEQFEATVSQSSVPPPLLIIPCYLAMWRVQVPMAYDNDDNDNDNNNT